MAEASDTPSVPADHGENPPRRDIKTLAGSVTTLVEDARYQLYAIRELSNVLHLELAGLQRADVYPLDGKMYDRSEAILHLARQLSDDWDTVDGEANELRERLGQELRR